MNLFMVTEATGSSEFVFDTFFFFFSDSAGLATKFISFQYILNCGLGSFYSNFIKKEFDQGSERDGLLWVFWFLIFEEAK